MADTDNALLAALAAQPSAPYTAAMSSLGNPPPLAATEAAYDYAHPQAVADLHQGSMAAFAHHNDRLTQIETALGLQKPPFPVSAAAAQMGNNAVANIQRPWTQAGAGRSPEADAMLQNKLASVSQPSAVNAQGSDAIPAGLTAAQQYARSGPQGQAGWGRSEAADKMLADKMASLSQAPAVQSAAPAGAPAIHIGPGNPWATMQQGISALSDAGSGYLHQKLAGGAGDVAQAALQSRIMAALSQAPDKTKANPLMSAFDKNLKKDVKKDDDELEAEED